MEQGTSDFVSIVEKINLKRLSNFGIKQKINFELINFLRSEVTSSGGDRYNLTVVRGNHKGILLALTIALNSQLTNIIYQRQQV